MLVIFVVVTDGDLQEVRTRRVSGHNILITIYLVVALKKRWPKGWPFFFKVFFYVGGKYRYESKDDGGDCFTGREVTFWGVVKSLVSPFVSKVSISPSAYLWPRPH